MKKITKKVPAKINLTLDVVGNIGQYHDIKSLVASIDIFDAITLSERKDHKITLAVKGLPLDCSTADNNAYKAAKLFYKNKSLSGVDIVIDKQIPIGGGLGGSSADIAGVLLGLKELHETEDDLLPLANALGSDSGYMLNGGYAVITGRGDKIRRVDCDKILYLLLLLTDGEISARSCYKIYDQRGEKSKEVTDTVETALVGGDVSKVALGLKNDLYPAATEIIGTLPQNIAELKNAGAINAALTGSGPTVFGIFETEKQRDKAYKQLKQKFGDKVVKAQTVIPN